jgi:hypothetical protein
VSKKPKTKKHKHKHKKQILTGRVTLAIVLGIVVIAVIALAVVNKKLELITASPVITNEEIAPPDTRVRIVLAPPLAQNYIKSRFLGKYNVPDWALDVAMPREIAVLFKPDLTTSEIYTTLFVNDKRLGPLLVQGVRQLDLVTSLDFIKWDSPTLVQHGRGYLGMQGAMVLLPAARDIVAQKWGKPPLALTPLPSSGGHLAEAVFDNRDGGACATLISLLAANGASTEQLTEPDVMDVFTTVSEADLYADFTEDEQLAFHLSVSFRPNTEPVTLQGFTQTFKVFIEDIQIRLNDELKGSSQLDGSTFTADYTLSDPDIWQDWVK